jgi:hypothetical protein
MWVVAGEHRRLDLVDLPVVLGVEDVVDRGESDVLVDAAVTGHEVGVEQLVIVGAGYCQRHIMRIDRVVCVGHLSGRIGVMGNVDDEGVACGDGGRRRHWRQQIALRKNRRRSGAGDQPRRPSSPRVSYRRIGIGQGRRQSASVDAQNVQRRGDIGPGAMRHSRLDRASVATESP